MMTAQSTVSERKRAPSKRALATRDRVFDAAERVFAQRGFDGATIRDIAAEAGEPVGTIHHHGGGKEVLFQRTVARRAEALSDARLAMLERIKENLTLETVLEAFIRPFFALSAQDGRWRDYARLVAYVSVDDRWREVSARHFDPTAAIFIAEMRKLMPGASPQQVAEGFVFSVSAMLALLTSGDRIAALGGSVGSEADQVDRLIRFCAAGMAGRLTR